MPFLLLPPLKRGLFLFYQGLQQLLILLLNQLTALSKIFFLPLLFRSLNLLFLPRPSTWQAWIGTS